MTNIPSKIKTTRRPDCVTKVRMGNTVLTVFNYFKQDTTNTAANKIEKVLLMDINGRKMSLKRKRYNISMNPYKWLEQMFAL